jgi:hypothetical protein
MASSPKNPAQGARPETLLALRDSLIEDLRTHQSADPVDERDASDRDHEAAAEFPHAPGITPIESPMVLRQANSPGDGITGDSPSLTPAESSANPKRLSALTGESSSDGPSLEEDESFSDTRDSPSFVRKSRRVAGGVFIIAILATVVVMLALGQDGELSPSWLSSVFRFATGSPTGQHSQAASTEDSAVLQRQLDQLAVRQSQIEKDAAARLAQLEKTVNEFALVRRQVEQLGGKQDQTTRVLAAQQDQLKAVASDVAVVRRQIEEVAAKQEQMAGNLATRQDQLMTTVSDVAAVRRQVNDLAAKQEQMAATSATPQDQLKSVVSDFVVMRRELEELATKQDQMAVDVAKLQAAEHSLSQKIVSLSQARTVRSRRQRTVPTSEKRPGH